MANGIARGQYNDCQTSEVPLLELGATLSYRCSMADTITIRTDDETEHALEVLTHGGISRSAAIRQAVLEAAAGGSGRADAPGSPADGTRRARRRQRGRRAGPRPLRRTLMIYLDSAAVVKLVHAEPESGALRGWLDERAETGWISPVLTESIISGPGQVRAGGRIHAARRARPHRPDRSGPAHPDPGPDRPARHRPQPRRNPPGHRLAFPPSPDVVRDLRQATAGRGDRSRAPGRFTHSSQRPPLEPPSPRTAITGWRSTPPRRNL